MLLYRYVQFCLACTDHPNHHGNMTCGVTMTTTVTQKCHHSIQTTVSHGSAWPTCHVTMVMVLVRTACQEGVY